MHSGIKVVGMSGLCALMLSCSSMGTSENITEPNPPLQDPERREMMYTDDDNMPTRQEMSEKASEINRKRNIEEFDSNDPATTPTEIRPRRADNAPVDTIRHNVPAKILSDQPEQVSD